MATHRTSLRQGAKDLLAVWVDLYGHVFLAGADPGADIHLHVLAFNPGLYDEAAFMGHELLQLISTARRVPHVINVLMDKRQYKACDCYCRCQDHGQEDGDIVVSDPGGGDYFLKQDS